MTFASRLAVGLAVLALPLVEIALLIKMSAILGFWTVVGIILLTALAGVLVIRAAGLSAFSRMFARVQEGGSPMQSLLDQFLSVTGGVLLVLPGLLGDAVGALLLVPGIRRLLMRSMASLFTVKTVSIRTRETQFDGSREEPDRTPGDVARGRITIIEGEYERLDDDRSKPGGRGQT